MVCILLLEVVVVQVLHKFLFPIVMFKKAVVEDEEEAKLHAEAEKIDGIHAFVAVNTADANALPSLGIGLVHAAVDMLSI
jgi:hypothetical protein